MRIPRRVEPPHRTCSRATARLGVGSTGSPLDREPRAGGPRRGQAVPLASVRGGRPGGPTMPTQDQYEQMLQTERAELGTEADPPETQQDREYRPVSWRP